jgi:hypothetical protein
VTAFSCNPLGSGKALCHAQHQISERWRRAFAGESGARFRALARTHREETPRGGACRRQRARLIRRARGAVAGADQRGAACFYVAGLEARVGESGEGAPRGARQDPPARTR